MKKKIIFLTILTLILLTGCGDPEAKQEEKLVFNEENYTYEESIFEHRYSKTYDSVYKDKGSSLPILSVTYHVVDDMLCPYV